MDPDNIDALLERYLKHETSQEENELIEAWLKENNNPHSQWPNYDPGQKDQWLTDVFSLVENSIQANERKVVVLSPRTRLWRRIASVAAVVTISFALYFGWSGLQKRQHPVQLSALSTTVNQQKQITLADGSRVWINHGSQLKYPEQFNGKLREVYLSGEAYFDIQHDAGKPFIIHTGKLVTTVLGTAFNIKEDTARHTIEITVTRGKVSVADGDKQLGIITPNQQISFNSITNQADKTEVNAIQATAWQETDLHFANATFAEAAIQLQKRFNVRIGFANDKIKDCRFTGTVRTGEKLDQVLNLICTSNNATWQTKEENNIIINGPGCDKIIVWKTGVYHD